MDKSSQLILVTGAANSGKSEWAESLAIKTQQPLIYIATATKNEDDEEWSNKISAHQKRRTFIWQTWEIPKKLPASISQIPIDNCALIDSLGTWVANYLEEDEQVWQQQVEQLILALKNAQTNQPIIIVAEETGWGVVPAYSMGRLFRSRLGKFIRNVGRIADDVYLVVGGYAVNISQIGTKIDD